MNIYEYFITKLCQEMVLFIHLLLRRQDLQIQMAVLHVCYCYLFRRCMPFKKKIKKQKSTADWSPITLHCLHSAHAVIFVALLIICHKC